jgi:hypothetical protein
MNVSGTIALADSSHQYSGFIDNLRNYIVDQ